MEGTPKGFTLLEILLVLVIIGILAMALIPRVIAVQSRARDAVRQSDLSHIGLGLDMYYMDHGGRYPSSFSGEDTALPRGTVGVLDQSLQGYLDTIPNDPSRMGIQARNTIAGCSDEGDTYAYYYDAIERSYVITSFIESGQGNTNDCIGGLGDGGEYIAKVQGALYDCQFSEQDIQAVRKEYDGGTYAYFIPPDIDASRGATYDICFKVQGTVMNYRTEDRLQRLSSCVPLYIEPGDRYVYEYKVRKHCPNGETTERITGQVLYKTTYYGDANSLIDLRCVSVAHDPTDPKDQYCPSN